ncbi:MAG: tetratricopeptide repeat protein [Planctomycetota bacterium]
MSTRARALRPYLWIALAAGAVYLGTLPSTFHYDDHHAVVQNPHLRSLANIPSYYHRPDMFSVNPQNAMYRPLLLTTFALDHGLWGQGAAWGWHLTSWLFHVIVACLVFTVLGSLTRGRPEARAWPWIGGLLFAVHPVHVETVCYVSARSSLLATLGVLSAFAAYLRAERETRAARRAGWLTLAGVCFAGGLLAKEIAIVFPAVLLVYEGLLRRDIVRAEPTRAAARYLPFLIIGLVYLSLRKIFLGTATAAVDLAGQGDVFTGGGRGFLPNLLTQAEVLFLYLRLMVWPSDLSVDHDIPVVTSWTDTTALLAVGTLLAIAVLALIRHRREPALVFGLAWFALSLAPTSLIPLNVVANEHRLYLPSIGLLIAGGAIWGRVPIGRPVFAKAIGACVLLTFGGVAWSRAHDWRNELTLWSEAVATDPGSHRAQLNLGNALSQRGDYAAALDHYRAALDVHPTWVPAQLNVAEALSRIALQTGDVALLDEAESTLRAIIAKNPSDRLTPLKLARVAGRRFELAAAPKDAERERDVLLMALAAAPQDVATRRSVAEHFESRGEWADAAQQYQALFQLRPDAVAFGYLAADLWRRAGDLELAIASLERLAASQPFEAQAHRLLAELYLELDPPRAELAERHSKVAQELEGTQ